VRKVVMTRWTRRSFLAATAALSAAPALGAPKRQPRRKDEPRTAAADVVIVGAGAAGIAAARRLAAAGRRFTLCEAANAVGGRCVTDTRIFGVPFDRGAHWIYGADINPIAKLVSQTGLEIYPAPPGQRVRIGRRYAREGELEDLLAALARANNAIADAARGRTDVSCAQVLPKDLGDWRATVEFMLGPFGAGKDLANISAADQARAPDHYSAAFCRQGFGALLARLADGLPVQLATPVMEIDTSSRGVEVRTARGRMSARAAIITASTNVLAAGKIRFGFDLPRRQADAIGRLRLGSYDLVALELPGNPLELRPDERVFEKSKDPRTGAIFANISGSALCTVGVGGSFGRDLSAKGERAMIAFVLDWLSELYGIEMKDHVKRAHATRWNQESYVLGAISSAAPGATTARRALMEPVRNRIWFAGEAAHESLWGTVGGAWDSGERAADAVLKVLGGR
jgi:monoamine oxidase